VDLVALIAAAVRMLGNRHLQLGAAGRLD
jgi:hypothetical protein